MLVKNTLINIILLVEWCLIVQLAKTLLCSSSQGQFGICENVIPENSDVQVFVWCYSIILELSLYCLIHQFNNHVQ